MVHILIAIHAGNQTWDPDHDLTIISKNTWLIRPLGSWCPLNVYISPFMPLESPLDLFPLWPCSHRPITMKINLLHETAIRLRTIKSTTLRISWCWYPVSHCLIIWLKKKYMLCILTREWVLCTPFAGWNQFFEAKTASCVLLNHKMYKIMQKI